MSKYFTLSFDDGTVQDIRFTEIINKYGLKCTFNINSGFFGQKHRLIRENLDVDHSELDADTAVIVYKGHEVAVHTVHHPNLLNLDKENIIKEVKDDEDALEKLFGYEIIGMAYPGGPYYNDFVIDTILENSKIRYARTTCSHNTFKMPDRLMEWHPTCHMNDEKLFELAETFIKDTSDNDMLFYVWGHSFEFDIDNSWGRLEEFCKYISGRDKIKYVTNGEIAKLSE